jgi:hypothetical protein
MTVFRETLRDVPHVDVVKNEWLAGFQHVVARVFPEGEDVHVDTQDPERWEPVILRPFADPESGEEINPERGAEFVVRLHEQIRGDYLFATELHDESNCPFHGGLVLPIEHVDPQPVATGAFH